MSRTGVLTNDEKALVKLYKRILDTSSEACVLFGWDKKEARVKLARILGK